MMVGVVSVRLSSLTRAQYAYGRLFEVLATGALQKHAP